MEPTIDMVKAGIVVCVALIVWLVVHLGFGAAGERHE